MHTLQLIYKSVSAMQTIRFSSTFKRTSRAKTRKERRYSGNDEAWILYRQEMQTARHEWIQQQKMANQERLALKQNLSERELKIAKEKKEAIVVSLKEQDDVLNGFGFTPDWPNKIEQTGLQIDSILQMLDSVSDAKPVDLSMESLVEKRKSAWKQFTQLRKEARRQNYLATKQVNSNNRLSHLLWMHHESNDWITLDNLDEKIDEVFNLGPKMFGASEKNYRAFQSLDKTLNNYMESIGKARLLAIQDALDGTITKPAEGAFSSPKSYPDVESIKLKIEEERRRASEPLAPKPSDFTDK
jgi:hypothetical protein